MSREKGEGRTPGRPEFSLVPSAFPLTRGAPISPVTRPTDRDLGGVGDFRSDGFRSIACARGRSSALSHRAIATVATALPIRLVIARDLGHEAIDADQQRQRGGRDGRDRRQRRRERDEAAAGHAGGALRRQHQDRRGSTAARANDRLHAARLRHEDRRHRHVDGGAVEIERIAGRHDQARPPACCTPSRSIFTISRGSADSDDEVPSTIRISSPM